MTKNIKYFYESTEKEVTIFDGHHVICCYYIKNNKITHYKKKIISNIGTMVIRRESKDTKVSFRFNDRDFLRLISRDGIMTEYRYSLSNQKLI